MQPKYLRSLFEEYKGDIEHWLTDGIMFMEDKQIRAMRELDLGGDLAEELLYKRDCLQRQLDYEKNQLRQFESRNVDEQERLAQFVEFKNSYSESIKSLTVKVGFLEKLQRALEARKDRPQYAAIKKTITAVLGDISNALHEYKTELKYAKVRLACDFEEFNRLFFNSKIERTKANITWFENEINQINEFLEMHAKHKVCAKILAREINDTINTNK